MDIEELKKLDKKLFRLFTKKKELEIEKLKFIEENKEVLDQLEALQEKIKEVNAELTSTKDEILNLRKDDVTPYPGIFHTIVKLVRFIVTDVERIPREYMTPDQVKINQASKEGVKIPGVGKCETLLIRVR